MSLQLNCETGLVFFQGLGKPGFMTRLELRLSSAELFGIQDSELSAPKRLWA